jgi:hypothetical protein
MAAKCRFCGKAFGNAQGVRAHLKSCAAYQQTPEKAVASRERPVGSGSLGSGSLGSGTLGRPGNGACDEDSDTSDLPLRQLQQRLAAERVRLQLREVEDAHAELDRTAEAKANERQRLREQEAEQARAKERAKDEATRTQEESARDAQRRDAEKRERQEKRRSVIQDVKRQVVDCWFAGFLVPPDFKPRVCLAIERELQPLAIEEVPLPELIRLAEGIRERMYREEKAKTEQAARLAQQRQRLVQHGLAYAQRELRDVDGLSFSDSWRIESAVKSDLESIAGTETLPDIEDRVEQIFEDHGLGCEDEEDD